MAARRTARALALALIAVTAAAVLGGPASVRAATPWAIAVSPAVLAEGVASDVTVTVISGDSDISRIVLAVPAGFTVVATSISSVPAGSVWTSVGAGSGPIQVTFSTTKGPWRLTLGAKGVFVVRVIATSSPLGAWIAQAYHNITVDSQLVSGPLQPLGPFVIVAASAPAPTPPPTPGPTSTSAPTSTPRPTPVPTVVPRVTTPVPTVVPRGATQMPSRSAPSGTTPDPPPSVSIGTFETPSAVGSPGSIAGAITAEGSAGPDGGTVRGGEEGALNVQVLPAGGTVQMDIQAVGVIGMFAWLVPGLALGLPGLLLLLIVLAQASFAAAFVPVTRRVFGVKGPRRRPDRPTSPG
jgi:hypothetical protein